MARFIVGCELLCPEDRVALRMLTKTRKDIHHGYEAAVILEDHNGYAVQWWYIPPNGDQDCTYSWIKQGRNRARNKITARRWLEEHTNGEITERDIN